MRVYAVLVVGVAAFSSGPRSGQSTDAGFPPLKWEALPSVEGGAVINLPVGFVQSLCPSATYKLASSFEFNDRSVCRNVLYNNPSWSWQLNVRAPEIVTEKGSLTRMCPFEPSDYNFFQSEFDWGSQYSDWGETSNKMISDSLNTFSLTTYGLCGANDMAEGSWMSYGFSGQTFSERIFVKEQIQTQATLGWCFTELAQNSTLDYPGECRDHADASAGSQRHSIFIGLEPGHEQWKKYKESYLRITEAYDFSNVDDTYWSRARLNGMDVSKLKEQTAYDAQSFTMPMYKERDFEAQEKYGTFELELGLRYLNTYRFSPPYDMFAMKPGVTYDLKVTAQLEGKTLLVGYYFPFSNLLMADAVIHTVFHPMIHPLGDRLGKATIEPDKVFNTFLETSVQGGIKSRN